MGRTARPVRGIAVRREPTSARRLVARWTASSKSSISNQSATPLRYGRDGGVSDPAVVVLDIETV